MDATQEVTVQQNAVATNAEAAPPNDPQPNEDPPPQDGDPPQSSQPRDAPSSRAEPVNADGGVSPLQQQQRRPHPIATVSHYGHRDATVVPDTCISHFREGKTAVIDYAHIYPLQNALIEKALSGAGAAATEYEAVKRSHYAGHIHESTQELFPVIMDSFGGMSDSARDFFNHVARVWGRRHNMHTSRAVPQVFARVNAALMHAIAANLCAASRPIRAIRLERLDRTFPVLRVADRTSGDDSTRLSGGGGPLRVVETAVTEQRRVA
jgi:hypothetical protein